MEAVVYPPLYFLFPFLITIMISTPTPGSLSKPLYFQIHLRFPLDLVARSLFSPLQLHSGFIMLKPLFRCELSSLLSVILQKLSEYQTLSLHQDFGSLNQSAAYEAAAIYKPCSVFNQVYNAWMFVILPLKRLPVFPSGVISTRGES